MEYAAGLFVPASTLSLLEIRFGVRMWYPASTLPAEFGAM
jgi:hypothetical protein